MIIGVKIKDADVQKLIQKSTKLKNFASNFKDTIESNSEASNQIDAEQVKQQLKCIINIVNEIKDFFENCYPFTEENKDINIYPNPYIPNENPYFIPKSPYPSVDPTYPDWSKMNQTWCNSNPKCFGGGNLHDENQKDSRTKSNEG